MAKPQHLAVLSRGARAWNRWRENRLITPDLRGAKVRGPQPRGDVLHAARHFDKYISGHVKLRETRARLAGVDLHGADLRKADLEGADLRSAIFEQADLSGANLRDAILTGADLTWASLRGADIRGADLDGANLKLADLAKADLRGCNLRHAILVEARLSHADLTGALIYGVSAWNVDLAGAIQADLVITTDDQPRVTVDNLKVAQFIHLILANSEIRGVIDTIASKLVLILGRFTPERKSVLDALREAIRTMNYVPILFDFEGPGTRDITETISILAHMARFVVADLTDAKSIPQELMRIVPSLPSVPVQPILLASQREYGMFEHFRRFPWVLTPFLYKDLASLLNALERRVIRPAEAATQRILASRRPRGRAPSRR